MQKFFTNISKAENFRFTLKVLLAYGFLLIMRFAGRTRTAFVISYNSTFKKTNTNPNGELHSFGYRTVF